MPRFLSCTRRAGFAVLLAAGCARPQPALAPAKPTEVIVEYPVSREVTAFEDFTGRTEAVAAVDIRARVTGHLKEIRFKDGDDVKKGDVLFQIDPDQYQHEYDRTKANLLLAQVHLARLRKDYSRVMALSAKGAASQEEVDKVAGDQSEAEASVATAEAAARSAKLNLDYCTISAPMSGRISRRNIDAGNLVKADDTILTNLVALDPIDAYFDIDERTLLRLRRLVREGKMPSARTTATKVKVGLADEDGFSLTGTINFIDNKLDAATGTLRLRAGVANPKLLLSPGLFVRFRLPIGLPHPAVLIPEEAVGTDQGQKFVYVVNEKDEIVYRKVQLGQEFDEGRAVESGVTPQDRVVVSGLQRVRPGAKVVAKLAAKKPTATAAVPAPAPAPVTVSVAPDPRVVRPQ